VVVGTITVALWERELEAVTAARPFCNASVGLAELIGGRGDMPALPPLEL